MKQQPRRPDAVAGHDDDLGRLELCDTVRVVIHRAGRHAVFVGRDLSHPAVRPQLHAGAERLRPIGNVSAGFRPLGTGRRAVSQMDTGRAAVILGWCNRAVGWPPVPPQPGHRLADLGATFAQRQGRQWRRVRGIGRVALQPRDPRHAIVLGKERFQRRIVDRPVIGHTVQGAHAEVRRVQPRIMRRVHHGRAADGVEILHLDRRVVVVNRIVGGPLADVRAGGVVAEHPRLVITPVGGIVGLLHPVPLFEAGDFHSCLGKAPGDRGARSARADDENVDLVLHPLPLSSARMLSESLTGDIAITFPRCLMPGPIVPPHGTAAYAARTGPVDLTLNSATINVRTRRNRRCETAV
jgi:hypothetical protein